MKIRTVTVFFVVSFFACLSIAAQSKPCGCADKRDLLNRLRVSQMAIQEYEFQIGTFSDKEAADGQPYLYSDDRLSKMQESLANALKSVFDSGVDNSSLSMDSTSCSITERGSLSNCMRTMSEAYYDVMQKACSENRLTRLPGHSFFEGLTMKQVAEKRIAAYREMQKNILRALNALPKDCRPNNWFGYVVYQKVSTTSSTRIIPPQNAGMSRPSAGVTIGTGGSAISGTKSTYIGTVYVEDGKASGSTGYAGYNFDSSTTLSGRIYCSPKKPDETVVQTNGRKDYAEGNQAGNGEFRLDVYPAKGKYHIYMRFFPVAASGRMISNGTSGGCAGKPFTYDNPLTTRLGTSDSYGVDETIDPGSPDYLEGSKTEKPPSGNRSSKTGDTSTTQTEEIMVRWMLRRLPVR